MPLDGIDHGAADTVRIIDAVIEALGPKGERWRKGGMSDASGRHCLRGALFYARRKIDVRGDRATDCILEAIRKIPNLPGCWASMEAFNDRKNTKFRDVRDVLLRARELAAIGAGV
jgi:hypothetical protein